MTEEQEKAAMDIPEDAFTCFRCSEKETCPYAGDPYNTDGDCLADK